MLPGRRLPREHREQERRQLPLVRRHRRLPPGSLPLGGRRGELRVGVHPPGTRLARQHPLPPQQPQATSRREPHRGGGHRAVRHPGVVQVRQGAPRLPQHLEGERHGVRPQAGHARPHRLPTDPTPQVPGTAQGFLVRRPVVVRGGDGRMIAMGQRPRFLPEPLPVGRVGGAHQRQRPPERVHHFLVVSVLAPQRLITPRPPGRQHPPGQMRRGRWRGGVIGEAARGGHVEV